MNNLKLSWERSWSLEVQSKDVLLLVSAFDIERNRLFFASANYIYTTTQLPSLHNEEVWRLPPSSMEAEVIDLEPGDSITTLDYLMEKEALIVGTSYGHLFLCTANGSPSELVGHVEGGVIFISPSPDGDLIGILTGCGKILLMTQYWDVLYETTLEDVPEDTDVCESTSSLPISFKGSISWRGDAKYFCTLSGEGSHSSLQKKLKIWERDSGALLSVSDSKAFMGTTLDWMPIGQKIAAVYNRLADKKAPLIVFFEKNGLERSSFSIHDEPIDANIDILRWNCDSDLLAAVVRCGSYDSVKIWLFNNNHWYLKQEIRHSKKDQVKLLWNPTNPLQLICWTVGGRISTYNYVYVTAVMENSMALVIDGSKVLVTPLSLTLMPLPLYFFNLKFPSAVCDIALCSKNSRYRLAAFLSDCSLSIADLPLDNNCEELEGKELSVDVCFSEITFQCSSHLTWLDSCLLLCFSQFGTSLSNLPSIFSSHKDECDGYYLKEFELSCSEDHMLELASCCGWHAKQTRQISLNKLVIGVVSNPTKAHSAFVQFHDGNCFEYSSQIGGLCEVDPKPYVPSFHDIGFTSSCPWMRVIPVTGSDDSWKPLLIGLDSTGGFHIGGKILCNSCSSFSLYSKSNDWMISHLILATKLDFLFIFDIADVLHGNIEMKYGNFIHLGNTRFEEENGNSIKIWERGSKIIGVLHGDEAAIVIQTHRGSLECIYPRKLIMTSIVNALDQKRYKDAINMVRRHRIDFNIIIDHRGWWEFIKSASEFVEQVNNLNYITEFVCAIRNEKFVGISKKVECGHDQSKMDHPSKISSVLLAIRNAVEECVLESPERELFILTTLARSDPPNLEKALERIKVIRDLELSGSDYPNRISYPSAEEALKHLLWLSDFDAVYDAALGIYDLNLAAMVVLNSQRDPKEFLPFLQDLEQMTPILFRYNVDLKLQRYESALKSIVLAGDAYHIDCMNLMKDNPQLFPLGVQLYSDPKKRWHVLEAWGDHLSDEKCFENAATTYLCCSSLEKAFRAYRACGHWRGVLTVAGLLMFEKNEMLRVAQELCEELQVVGKPGEAAKIALEYCGDVNGGVNLLISSRDWEEALRVSLLNRNEELVSAVRKASLECACLLIGEYEEGLEKVGKYLTRYLAIRQRRLLLAAKVESDNHSVNDFDDTASESSSNFSGMSAYTTGTRKTSISISSKGSKARDMKHQRNRGRIRAGSRGEEQGLVDHLGSMGLSRGAKAELKSLINALLMMGEEESARKVQRAAENFQLAQMGASKLTLDTASTHSIDVHVQDYSRKLRTEMLAMKDEEFSWRSPVLTSL